MFIQAIKVWVCNKILRQLTIECVVKYEGVKCLFTIFLPLFDLMCVVTSTIQIASIYTNITLNVNNLFDKTIVWWVIPYRQKEWRLICRTHANATKFQKHSDVSSIKQTVFITRKNSSAIIQMMILIINVPNSIFWLNFCVFDSKADWSNHNRIYQSNSVDTIT